MVPTLALVDIQSCGNRDGQQNFWKDIDIGRECEPRDLSQSPVLAQPLGTYSLPSKEERGVKE
jgi:hypothetical protein